MAISIKLSDKIVTQAKTMSRALNRSTSGQIEHWARIGQIAEENPDLTYDFIKQLLIAKEESATGQLQPYEFDVV